jgi:mono/diheme cytochrome c family protein
MDLRASSETNRPRVTRPFTRPPFRAAATFHRERSASLLLVSRNVKASAFLLVGALALAGFAAAACGHGPEGPDDTTAADNGNPTIGAAPGSNDPHDPKIEQLPDPLSGLKTGQEQMQAVCSRGQEDAVTKIFCNGNGTSITSIVDLQKALGLEFKDRSDKGTNGTNGNPAFALLGHSSSLVARDVSAINPRAFIFSAPPGQPVRIPGYVVMGFARGEPFVEIAAEDPNTRKLTLYLARFSLPCEADKSCGPGELLTPAVEKNWKGITLYDDEDLKNTIADCRQCHQPNGPGSKTMLRMQELQDSWTHWFRNDDQHPNGLALLQDFRAAHGVDEDYAGIPGHILQLGDGAALEDFIVGQGFQQQPNFFNSKRIEQEMQALGQSPTWQSLYQTSLAGQAIPPPYFKAKVTDPDKLEFATNAYQTFLKTGSTKDLPDIRRVFDDGALPWMSMRPKAGATGEEMLVQMCSQCHNSRLDPSLSRAKFDATNLAGLDPGVKAMAISRMQLPASDIRHMPPAMIRTIPDDQLQTAIDALQK